MTILLYRFYDITIDQPFFDNTDDMETRKNELTEDIPIEKSLIRQNKHSVEFMLFISIFDILYRFIKLYSFL